MQLQENFLHVLNPENREEDFVRHNDGKVDSGDMVEDVEQEMEELRLHRPMLTTQVSSGASEKRKE